MKEMGRIKYSVFFHTHKDPCIKTKCRDHLLYFLESRIVSNGGCSLTHVNMRCLGDFAEMSWLQVGSSRCELWKKQIGIGTRSDNLEVSYPPVLNMSVVN